MHHADVSMQTRRSHHAYDAHVNTHTGHWVFSEAEAEVLLKRHVNTRTGHWVFSEAPAPWPKLAVQTLSAE